MASEFARWLYTSKAWRELRLNLIIERGPVCQRLDTTPVRYLPVLLYVSLIQLFDIKSVNIWKTYNKGLPQRAIVKALQTEEVKSRKTEREP